MPIYEYSCQKCGEFEVTQRITDDPLKRCPTCRGKVKKLISNSSFHLKGSGWYITDYARKNGSASSESPSPSKSADTKSVVEATPAAETKTDSKADTKPAKAAKKESSAKAA